LRIEDTDQERLVPGGKEMILKELRWFGIVPDEKPLVQSERLELYKRFARDLVKRGHAYYCFCSEARLEELRKNQETSKKPPRYDRYCLGLSQKEIEEKLRGGQSYVIRQKMPDKGKLKFIDLVRGELEFDLSLIDDSVLLKSDGFPTYHLASVVDDHSMEITHVIRTEEWLSSTPKHILLHRSFGWQPPEYAHPPLVLNPDRTKMSKRLGNVSVASFRAAGYLPEALINFLVLLGWNPKTEQEFFTLKELIEIFDISGINKAGAVFDREKLDYFNNHYIRKYKPEELFEKIIGNSDDENFGRFKADKNFAVRVLRIIQPRLKTISFNEVWQNSFYFYDLPEYEAGILIFKKSDKERTLKGLRYLKTFIQNSDDKDWASPESLNGLLQKAVKDVGLDNGDIFWPARAALSGLEKSSSPGELFWVLRKEESLSRIKSALNKLTLI